MPSTQTVFSRSPISSMFSISTRTALGSPQPGQSECVLVPSRGERVNTLSIPGLTALPVGVPDSMFASLMSILVPSSCVALRVDLADLAQDVQSVDLRTDAEARSVHRDLADEVHWRASLDAEADVLHHLPGVVLEHRDRDAARADVDERLIRERHQRV